MFIPLQYNLRNLAVRRLTTLLTALSIAVTVVVFIATMALVEGIRLTFVSTGEPLNVLAIRRNAQSETGSIIEPDAAAAAHTSPALARSPAGEPLLSVERIVYVNIDRLRGGASNVVIRGTTPIGRQLRPAVSLVAGRWYRDGAGELTVSRTIAGRFAHCALGDQLVTGSHSWTVVGIFDGGGTAFGSEMWTSADDIGRVFQRPNYSVILGRAADASARRTLIEEWSRDPRVQVDAKGEREFYAEQTKASVAIEILGRIIAGVMAVGSAFAAMNAMYAAVASRSREVAILRAIGFTPIAISASFVVEALLLAALGGIIGALVSLPIDGITTGTMNFISFSEMTFHFRITPSLLLRGFLFAETMGLLGGVLPAVRASRLSTVSTLRAL